MKEMDLDEFVSYIAKKSAEELQIDYEHLSSKNKEDLLKAIKEHVEFHEKRVEQIEPRMKKK